MREQNHNATRDDSEDTMGSKTNLESLQSREGVHGANPLHSDDCEKGGEEEPPRPVGFWSPQLSKTRLQVFGLWLRTTGILAVFILAILSLYWAVLFNVEQNLNSLIVYVVDFDGQVAPYTGGTPLIGPLITKMTEEMVLENKMPHLGYVTLPPSAFSNDPIQVREAVFAQQAYASVVINPNATALLRQAVETGNMSYDPLGACQITYVEARDQDTYYDYVIPELNTLQTEITSMFGAQWVPRVLANTSISRTTLEKVPQALSPAIGFSMYNLRPFVPPAAIPATTIGLIYLIIIAFFSFTFFLPIHMKFVATPGQPSLKFWQLILWRWVATLAAYLVMSLAYSLISLAFQIPFNNPPAAHSVVATGANAFGRGTFPVYWMVNFVGMIALGLACENVAMFIGQPWTAMWLIFWVISNVSTSFYPIELSPRFFYWGYAWPLHQIVEASRTIIFDTHSRLGLNFGVLFVWCGVNSILFPPSCYFQRWMTQREKKKEAESKKED